MPLVLVLLLLGSGHASFLALWCPDAGLILLSKDPFPIWPGRPKESAPTGGLSRCWMVKNQPARAGEAGDVGSIPGSGRSPRQGNGRPLQYSCLGNPRDRGAWEFIQSVGSQRIRHSLAAEHEQHTHRGNSPQGSSTSPDGFLGEKPWETFWTLFRRAQEGWNLGCPNIVWPNADFSSDEDTEAFKRLSKYPTAINKNTRTSTQGPLLGQSLPSVLLTETRENWY